MDIAALQLAEQNEKIISERSIPIAKADQSQESTVRDDLSPFSTFPPPSTDTTAYTPTKAII